MPMMEAIRLFQIVACVVGSWSTAIPAAGARPGGSVDARRRVGLYRTRYAWGASCYLNGEVTETAKPGVRLRGDRGSHYMQRAALHLAELDEARTGKACAAPSGFTPSSARAVTFPSRVRCLTVPDVSEVTILKELRLHPALNRRSPLRIDGALIAAASNATPPRRDLLFDAKYVAIRQGKGLKLGRLLGDGFALDVFVVSMCCH
jgi:hypothetical protein